MLYLAALYGIKWTNGTEEASKLAESNRNEVAMVVTMLPVWMY
jgi:hypothetical protein